MFTNTFTMFSAYFWKSACERAIKSFAQSLLAILGAGQVGVLDVAWTTALSTAAMAAVLSVLTSIGSAKIGAPDDPSLVPSSSPSAPAAPATPAAPAAAPATV